MFTGASSELRLATYQVEQVACQAFSPISYVTKHGMQLHLFMYLYIYIYLFIIFTYFQCISKFTVG